MSTHTTTLVLVATLCYLGGDNYYVVDAASAPNGYFIDLFTHQLYNFHDPYLNTYTSLCTLPYFNFYAGDFVNGSVEVMYAINYDDMSLYSVSMTACSATLIGSTGLAYGSYYSTGMTWSTTLSAMIASFTTISYSYLYTINLQNGTATYLMEIVGAPIVIDIASVPSGLIYVLDASTDNTFWADPIALTSGQLGYAGYSLNYAQGMSYDPCTDEVYIAAYNIGNSKAEFRLLDRSTGSTVLYATMPGGEDDCLVFESHCVEVDDSLITDDPLMCDDATEILSLPSSYIRDTGDAPYGSVSCWGAIPNRGNLFLYTATQTGNLRAETCQGSTLDTAIVVFTSCVTSGIINTCVTWGTDECGQQSIVTWQATAGVTYWMFVTSFTGLGVFNLTVSALPDLLACTAAYPITSLPYESYWNSPDVQMQYVSCFYVNDPGVLWVYTTYSDGPLKASTCDDYTNFNTSIYILSECDTSGQIWGCSAYARGNCGTNGAGSSIQWFGSSGYTYYILVSGPNFGQFKLTVEDGSNLACSDAILVDSDPFVYTSTMYDAVDVWMSCIGFWTQGILFVYTASASGIAQVDTCGSGADTQLYVFSGCLEDGYVAVCLGNNDDFCDRGSSVTWDALEGENYYILVTGYYYYSMDFTLTLTGPSSITTDFSAYVVDTSSNAVLHFTTTATVETVCNFDYNTYVVAGDFAYGDTEALYIYDYWGNFYRLHLSDCALDYVGWQTEDTNYVYGMAWSDFDGEMYAVTTDLSNTYLYTVDMTWGSLEYRNVFVGTVIADIAADSYGYIYGYDVASGYFVYIDINQDYTMEFAVDYGQELWYTMAYDLCTETLYALTLTTSGSYQLNQVNTLDGSKVLLGVFYTPSYFTAFSIGGCSNHKEDSGLSTAGIAILITLGVLGGVGVAFALGACCISASKKPEGDHEPTSPETYESATVPPTVPVMPTPGSESTTAPAVAPPATMQPTPLPSTEPTIAPMAYPPAPMPYPSGFSTTTAIYDPTEVTPQNPYAPQPYPPMYPAIPEAPVYVDQSQMPPPYPQPPLYGGSNYS